MRKTKKSSKPKLQELPKFQPCDRVGSCGPIQLITDINGRIWRIDIDLGEATPVKFNHGLAKAT